MYNETVRLGVPLLLNQLVYEIITDDEGMVLGAMVEDQETGKVVRWKAKKAVLLASGGYKSNTAMLRNWEPRFDDDISAGGEPTVISLGEASEAAVDIGAAQRDMSFVCEYRFKWGTKIYQNWNPADITLPMAGGTGIGCGDFKNVMIVKNDGKRFVDEVAAGDYPQWPFYNAFLTLEERPRAVWALVDSTIAATNNWRLDDIKAPKPDVSPCLSPDYVAIGNTIEELASKMGVPAAGLKAEVDRYNEFAATGKDTDFGKKGIAMKIETGPFYAMRMTFFAHDQQSGLTVNSKAQVVSRKSYFGPSLDIDDRPIIKRLYAGGEVAGGYYGQERGHGKIGTVIYWGRIAGQEAAKESNWE
jgi:urocanate reductase